MPSTLEVKIKNTGGQPLPTYQTELSAGMDLHASIENPVDVMPGERVLIGTGLFIELPGGFEAQIRPRSGLALKHGITVLNSPGTIDADYRGEIKVLLINLGQFPFSIQSGERIAQMVISRHETVTWKISENLGETLRGEGGYGSSGV